MSKKRFARGTADNWRVVRDFAVLLLAALSSFGSLFSAKIFEPNSPDLEVHSSKASVYFLFLGGVVLLTLIVVGIARLIRHKNLNVILLKQRLSEIYVSALRKSAFNPQLQSPTTSDE